MLKLMIPIALVAAAAVAATAFAVSFSPSAGRDNCPGQIVCPLNGELVCKDRCPLGREATSSSAELPKCCQTS